MFAAIVRTMSAEHRILAGDVRARLRELPDQSVYTICTSPPYWSQRAYGTDPQVWDDAGDCGEHEWGDVRVVHQRGQHGQNAQVGNSIKEVAPRDLAQGQWCQRCGAWRGELGSEPSPDDFIRHLVAVFQE